MKIFVSQGYTYNPGKAHDLALSYARRVARDGHIPISPVLLFHNVYDNGSEYQRVILNCFSLIKDCDELWIFDRHGESQGVCAESAFAEMMGIPVRVILNCPLSGQYKGGAE